MKLTISLRQEIASKESNKRFKDKISEARTVFNQSLILEVKKIYGPEIAMVPKSLIADQWIRTTYSIRVKGKQEDIDSHTSFVVAEALPIKCNAIYYMIEATDKIIENYRNVRSLEIERDAFKQDLLDLLHNFYTSKPLLEVLPELAEYFKEDKKDNTKALVPIELINRVKSQLLPLTN